jgi:hypothetical protein
MKKIFLYSLSAFLLLAGCKKNNETQKDTSSKMDGSILLFDEGNSVQDPSGITVSIENTNPLISTTTDNKGNFSLPVPGTLNTFTVTYSSPDIGTFKSFYKRNASGTFSKKGLDNVFYEGNYSESLGYKSTVTVNSFSLSLPNDSTLTVNCNISSPNTTGEKYIRLLIQKDLPGISLNTIDQTNPRTYGVYIPVTNGNNTQNFCLKCSGICQNWVKNDKIYMTAFGESAYSNLYVDPVSGKLVFPNLNPNNNNVVASFIMPF